MFYDNLYGPFKTPCSHGLNEMVNLIWLAERFVCLRHRGTVHKKKKTKKKPTYAHVQRFRHGNHSTVKVIHCEPGYFPQL